MNADALSHLPLPDYPSEVPLPGNLILLLNQLQYTPVPAKQIHSMD